MTGTDGERDGDEMRPGEVTGEEAAVPANGDIGGPAEDQVAPTEARLALDEDERLPWLESAEDEPEDNVDAGRVIGFVVLGLVALALIIGAIWWVTNRGRGPGTGDGSVIAANDAPYKVAPEDPGGKTFEGTGDSSFKVSEGQRPVGKVADDTPPASPAPTKAAPAKAAPTAAAAPPSATPEPQGVGVQVGAFSTRAGAEAAWSTLAGRHEALSGLKHRVVEGRADIGTVYRLQALAGDVAGAKALCDRLQAGGLKCQVKR